MTENAFTLLTKSGFLKILIIKQNKKIELMITDLILLSSTCNGVHSVSHSYFFLDIIMLDLLDWCRKMHVNVESIFLVKIAALCV